MLGTVYHRVFPTFKNRGLCPDSPHMSGLPEEMNHMWPQVLQLQVAFSVLFINGCFYSSGQPVVKREHGHLEAVKADCMSLRKENRLMSQRILLRFSNKYLAEKNYVVSFNL